MTLEINPVLAGTYDAPDYVPPHDIKSFQSASATEDANGVDARRYTQFDRSATEAGSTTDFSFSDLLDAINPFEHIPILSSIYREITGEKINPVARVTGDILYGGLLGGASLMASGVGAIGDAVMEQETGKDSTGIVMAALFGPDSPSSPAATTQLAETSPPASPAAAATVPSAPSALAALKSPAQTQPHAFSLAKPAIPLKGLPQFAGASIPSTGDPKMDAATQALLASKAFPVDPSKMPYGGVIDPSALQGENMALALASSAPGAQMGGMVYTGKAFTARSNAPPPLPAPSPAANTQTAAGTPSTGNQSVPNYQNPIPAALIHDLAAMRGINQYRSTASQSTPAGTNLDVVN